MRWRLIDQSICLHLVCLTLIVGTDGPSQRVSSTHTWKSTRSPCTMKRRPRSRSSLLTLRSFHISNLNMIIHHLLHLRKGQAMTMPMMTHRRGACFRDNVDLHLGQKPKLGGRYTDNSLIYISYLVGPLYIHVSLSSLFLFLFLLSKTQKDQKYFRLFLFVYLFSLLALVCFTCYFRFDIWKIQKYFALFVISFCPCFKNRKPKNICCSSLVLWSLLQSSVSRDSIGAWYSLHIIQATQVKGNNDDIWQPKMW
jgi:hypothetical protein